MEEASEEDTPEYESYEDDSSNYERTDKKDEAHQEAIDTYLQAEVLLPIAGEMLTGRVSKRKRDADGNLRGSATNPIMDTRMYVVTFPDKREAEYSAGPPLGNLCPC
jgi:TATA-binding protein-associated factor Taf7